MDKIKILFGIGIVVMLFVAAASYGYYMEHQRPVPGVCVTNCSEVDGKYSCEDIDILPGSDCVKFVDVAGDARNGWYTEGELNCTLEGRCLHVETSNRTQGMTESYLCFRDCLSDKVGSSFNAAMENCCRLFSNTTIKAYI